MSDFEYGLTPETWTQIPLDDGSASPWYFQIEGPTWQCQAEVDDSDSDVFWSVFSEEMVQDGGTITGVSQTVEEAKRVAEKWGGRLSGTRWS